MTSRISRRFDPRRLLLIAVAATAMAMVPVILLHDGAASAATLTLTTSLSGGGQSGATITVPGGTVVTDTATLSNATASAGGTVVYTVYSDIGCTKVVGSADTVTVASGTVPASSPVSLNPGIYYWTATYSGDAGNAAATSACLSEVLMLTGTPQSGAIVAAPVNDKALTGTQGSNAAFDFFLPHGAACSGDTLTGGYHVYSYIEDNVVVPDPGTLTYNSGSPNTGYPLFLIAGGGTIFAAANTGVGGVINQPTAFEFGSSYDPFGSNAASLDAIYPGTFNIGISCVTPGGAADKFWNAQVTFAADASDPNGFTWIVTNNAAATSLVLSAAPVSPQARGTSVTMTATVTPANANGTVQFLDGTTPLGTTTLSSGVATFTANAPTTGTHSYSAVFTAADTTAFASSTSNVLTYVISSSSSTTTTSTSTTSSTTTPQSSSTTTSTDSTTSTSTAAGSTTTTAAVSSGSANLTGTNTSAGSSTSTDPTTTALAATGAPISTSILWAVLLIVVGGLLVEIARGRLGPAPAGRAGRGRR